MIRVTAAEFVHGPYNGGAMNRTMLFAAAALVWDSPPAPAAERSNALAVRFADRLAVSGAERAQRPVRVAPLDRESPDGIDGRLHGETRPFLLENGYTNTTFTGVGGGSNAIYPQTVLRVGTAEPHLDFEVGFPSAETSSVGGPRVSGSSDVSLATKYELGFSSNADWGVYGAITYPTGSHAFTAGNAEFTGDFNGPTRSIPSSASRVRLASTR